MRFDCRWCYTIPISCQLTVSFEVSLKNLIMLMLNKCSNGQNTLQVYFSSR